MLILTIRTDNPEAEIGLYEDNKQLAYEEWAAHRELSITIHNKIDELLKKQNKDWQDIEGVVLFKGPGSFTGLRIGASVANALASSLHVPIVGSLGKNWLETGLSRLKKNENDEIVLPDYGRPVHITTPRK